MLLTVVQHDSHRVMQGQFFCGVQLALENSLQPIFFNKQSLE